MSAPRFTVPVRSTLTMTSDQGRGSAVPAGGRGGSVASVDGV